MISEVAEVEPPPVEEFKRLMESLGPGSLFDEDFVTGDSRELSDLSDDEFSELVAEVQAEIAEEDKPIARTTDEKGWFPKIYSGGKPEREFSNPMGPPGVDFGKNIGLLKPKDLDAQHDAPVRYQRPPDEGSEWRLQVVSVVTNSSKNSTALEMVKKIYDYIREGTENDKRIQYQTICYKFADDEPFEELEDSIQMWCESYNTYHLIDGAAMRQVWGSIMPHIVLGEKNLDAIVAKVKWALEEDTMKGAMLTPRLRRVRLRGGAAQMTTGFNTEHLDAEFSVVSVR